MFYISRFFKLFPVVLLAFILTACEEQKTQSAAQLPPIQVEAIEVSPQTFALQNEYMGKALGFLSVEVRAQVPGILLKKYYKEGDFVTKGQLLFEIDPSQAQAAYNQANAELSRADSALANAKREYDRIIPLYKKNAVSQRDRDQAEANYLSAEANMQAATAAKNQAQINLGYTKVEAPISGYTSLEARNEGNLISLTSDGSLLTTINQTDPMYITFSFAGSEVSRMNQLAAKGYAELAKSGSQASIKLMTGEEYPHKGTLDFIDTQVNPLTNAIEARAEFPNPDGALLPNMFVNITIEGGTLKNVYVIPQSAVVYTAEGSMVYLLGSDNKVSLKKIDINFPLESYFLLNSGLEEGDTIISKGISKIFPGSEVSATVTKQKVESNVSDEDEAQEVENASQSGEMTEKTVDSDLSTSQDAQAQ